MPALYLAAKYNTTFAGIETFTGQLQFHSMSAIPLLFIDLKAYVVRTVINRPR